jgi:hypothetical protein
MLNNNKIIYKHIEIWNEKFGERLGKISTSTLDYILDEYPRIINEVLVRYDYYLEEKPEIPEEEYLLNSFLKSGIYISCAPYVIFLHISVSSFFEAMQNNIPKL